MIVVSDMTPLHYLIFYPVATTSCDDSTSESSQPPP